MNVLMSCISAVSGGGKAYLRNMSLPLLAEFRAEGKHNLFFLAHADQFDSLVGIPVSNIIPSGQKRLPGLQRVIWEWHNLPSFIAAHNIDVVFTPYQVGISLSDVRNVLMIRNMEPFYFDHYKYSVNTWIRNKVLSVASSSCLRQADRVIAVSKFAATQLVKIGVEIGKVSIVHHGSPTFSMTAENDVRRLAHLRIFGSFILTCGSMLPYRRYEDVIQSFARSSSALRSDALLVIAGAGADLGYKKALLELISASPHPERILMLGDVPWPDMELLYRNCVCCVIASEIEACPNIALEAMSAGACIVAVNRPPLPEIFGNCAIIFQPRNVSALASCLDDVLSNRSKRDRYGALAAIRSKSFSWAKAAKNTYVALTHW